MPKQTHIPLNNHLSELTTLATAIENFAEQTELDMKTQFNLNLALDELVTNIINHAYNDTNLHQIEITLSYDANLLSITLTDDGKPFDPTKQEASDVTSDLEQREVGGLGLHFVRQLMDKMIYQRIGSYNQLTLEKNLGGSASLKPTGK